MSLRILEGERTLQDVFLWLVTVISAAWMLVLSARIVVPVPGSPVPVTGQTFVLMIMVAFLGGVRSAAAVSLYLFHGLAGFPAFAFGGGPIYLSGPTGGYLLGFLLFAGIIGTVMDRLERRTFPRLIGIYLAGQVVIYLPGLLWLSRFVPSGTVLTAGLYPFLPGDLLKIVSAAFLVSGLSSARAAMR
jgi:biotin transporter BioY